MRTKYASTRFSIVKRSKGQSAVDAASYISRSVLVSEYDGKTYRPKYHEDLVHCEINLPEYAPEEWLDRAVLWNSVELNEKQKNAQLCRTLKAALPNDWSYELAEETVRDYVQRNFVSKGMCADWAIHDSVNQNGIHNLHFHLMLTLRPVEENGKWGAKQRKEYILDKDGNKIRNKSGRGFKSRAVDVNDWNEKGNSRKWRKDLTDTINVVNDRIGLPEYWEHRSFKELGLEQEPTRHLGPIASALERKGIRTEKGDANRAIMEHNQTLQRARMFYDIAWNSVKNLEKWEQEKAAEAAKNAAEKKAGKMAGDIPAAQEGEAEQTAVGSIQKETSGTKEVSVFAAMKNEVLEMLECILAAFGRLHLPLIQAPNLKKVSNRAALMDIENVQRFVEEKGIDSFEALETFAVQQEASKKEAEEICNRDGREIRRLKELSEAYAAYAPYIPIRNEYLQKKGIAQAVYHSQHKKELETAKELRIPVYELLREGEKFTPKKWEAQIKELTQEYEKQSRRYGRSTVNLAYVELLRHNRKIDEREQKNKDQSQSRQHEKMDRGAGAKEETSGNGTLDLYIVKENLPGCPPAGRKEIAMSKDCRTTKNRNNSLTFGVLAGIILCQHWYLWRDFMQRKAGNRRREPIRYVVEHVYSGKESMEKVLTAVSEEAAKQNVKEKLENQKKVG